MNNPRANIANLIGAGGAALLILSLFLGWIGGGDESFSAWKLFSFADIVLFVIGIAALALAGAHVAGQAAALPPFLRPSILKWLGTVALTIALLFTIELTSGQFEGDMKFGAILGILAGAAILAGGILNDRPDLAAKLNEATAGIGGGQPGVGPGPGAGQQGGSGGQPGGGAVTPGPGPSAQPQSPPQQPQSPPQQPQAQPQTAPQPAQTPSAQPAQGGGGSSGPAPGWYPDPQGQKRLRYWDGSRWTEQTSD